MLMDQPGQNNKQACDALTLVRFVHTVRVDLVKELIKQTVIDTDCCINT